MFFWKKYLQLYFYHKKLRAFIKDKWQCFSRISYKISNKPKTEVFSWYSSIKVLYWLSESWISVSKIAMRSFRFCKRSLQAFFWASILPKSSKGVFLLSSGTGQDLLICATTAFVSSSSFFRSFVKVSCPVSWRVRCWTF